MTVKLWNGSSSVYINTSSGVVLADSAWHHHVIEFSSSGASIFIDGILVYTDSTNYGLCSFLVQYIGSYDGSGYWLDGYLDELRLYSRTLSISEIKMLYNFPSGISPGMITGNQILTSSLSAGNIKASAIIAAKIATSAVTSVKIMASSIVAVKVATSAIVAKNIATSAVTAIKLQASSVTSAKIAASSVIASKIKASAVVTAGIATSAITAVKISAESITTAKLNTGAVVATSIAAGAITTPKLYAGAVTATMIAANAVYTSAVVANSITTAKLALNAVTASIIAAGAITSAKIATGAVVASQIAAGAINAQQITLDSPGYIESSNFSTGSTGFKIDWAGNAEFNSVTLNSPIFNGTISPYIVYAQYGYNVVHQLSGSYTQGQIYNAIQVHLDYHGNLMVWGSISGGDLPLTMITGAEDLGGGVIGLFGMALGSGEILNPTITSGNAISHICNLVW
jgi:hypothetical protein